MKRAGLALVSVMLAGAAPASAQEPTAERHVVYEAVKRPPKQVTKRKEFVPPARPGVGVVRNVIIPAEAALWGASVTRLRCRVFGESGYRWWATNGQYQGVGQFAHETFYRGMASIGTRKVVKVRAKTRKRRGTVVRVWSDGSSSRSKSRPFRQRVIVRKVGWISRYPERRHTWAQVRIMARSMVGRGNVYDSEWEVRC